MRLKSIYISQYKNLKNFKLSFLEDNFLEVFVGKNGSGKSNFFEALIEVFRHIYEFDTTMPHEIYYDYKISYEIFGVTTTIEFNGTSGELKVNDVVLTKISTTPTPDNILIYYAGQNDTISEVLMAYQSKFLSRVKTAEITESRKFIGINSDYKDILLSLLLLQGDDCPTKKFVIEKLGVANVSDDLKLNIKRPAYAKRTTSNKYNVQNNDAKDKYWKLTGSSKVFLDKLEACVSDFPDNGIRTEGYLPDTDSYQFYFSLQKIRDSFQDISLLELFRNFDNLKTLEMLDGISIPLTLGNGLEATSSSFSDGQFQTIYLFAVSEIFKESNSLTLLDEPDSFLHPEWQADCVKQIHNVSTEAVLTNHVMMTSHSAVSLIQSPQQKIRYFDLKDGFANVYPLPKRVAVECLCSDVIKYSEDEQILSVVNTIQIANKPVLFTEGSTDPLILKEAWFKLYHEEMPFIPFYAFSCTYISQLLTDDRIHNEMAGLPVFALFDFDKAYNSWNGLNGDVIEENPKIGLIKKWAHGESYAMMLPVPDNPQITSQVINPTTGETYGGDSLCEIEHMFYGSEKVEAYFSTKRDRGGELIIFSSDANKTKFAKEVVSTVEAEYFEVFRPMFEFIKAKSEDAIKLEEEAKAE
ncbi:MAG: AAA family ATPase [Oceanospirillaceae bacterium]|jgi:AAA15 family ATPase/GTPase